MIQNCILTRSDTSILRGWDDKDNDRYSNMSRKLHSGVDVSGHSAYSICDGLVVSIGISNEDKYTVIVQYQWNVLFCYCNLICPNVQLGHIVRCGQLIGTADQFIHFECLSDESSTGIWPVRIQSITYYKVDPTEYIDGTIDLSSTN